MEFQTPSFHRKLLNMSSPRQTSLMLMKSLQRNGNKQSQFHAYQNAIPPMSIIDEDLPLISKSEPKVRKIPHHHSTSIALLPDPKSSVKNPSSQKLDQLIQECNVIYNKSKDTISSNRDSVKTETKKLCEIISELTSRNGVKPLSFDDVSKELNSAEEYEKSWNTFKVLSPNKVKSEIHLLKSIKKGRPTVWKVNTVRFKRITSTIV
jgi:hypothetical protein